LVDSALSWVNGLAGEGGTEFLPALRLALEHPRDPRDPRTRKIPSLLPLTP